MTIAVGKNDGRWMLLSSLMPWKWPNRPLAAWWLRHYYIFPFFPFPLLFLLLALNTKKKEKIIRFIQKLLPALECFTFYKKNSLPTWVTSRPFLSPLPLIPLLACWDRKKKRKFIKNSSFNWKILLFFFERGQKCPLFFFFLRKIVWAGEKECDSGPLLPVPLYDR